MCRSRRVVLVVLALQFTAPAFAAEDVLVETPYRVFDAVESALIYDDGELDNSVRNFVGKAEYAQQFVAPSNQNELLGFSVCLERVPGDAANGSLEINLYHDSGSGPGALIDSFTADVVQVTAVSFHVFDTSALDLILPKNFYIGIVLDRQVNDLYLCLDYDGIAGNRPVYRAFDDGPFTDFRDSFPSIKTFMIRAAVDSEADTTACDAGGDAIFLLDDRFRVDACWRTSGNSGTAKLSVEDGTGATMWFFNANNPELFIKVRDACVDPFDRYWVFAAGLTNVEVTITVTDTETDFQKTYFNPLNMPFESVQDTSSFATCP